MMTTAARKNNEQARELELVSIGSELLSGRTLNRHAQTLGAALTAIGLRLARDTTVPDDPTAIQDAVREALQRVKIVVVSGGLGPTGDDITRDALSDLLGRRVVPSPEALRVLHQRYVERGRTVTPASERQALVLEGAAVLVNAVGMAPGEQIDLPEGRTLFILPGPPVEFLAVLEAHVLPWLREHFNGVQPDGIRVLTLCGIGESDVVHRMETAGFCAGDSVLGFYPGKGRVEIRITAPASCAESLDCAEETLRALLAEYLVSGDEEEER